MGVIYNQFKKKLIDGAGIDLDTDTIKVALLDSGYTPDQDTQEFFDDVNADEVSGAGYVAGGQALTGASIVVDTTNNRSVFDANDVTWLGATLTARYAVVYKDTGTPATSPLLGYIDFLTDQSVVGANFVIEWGNVGILTIT